MLHERVYVSLIVLHALDGSQMGDEPSSEVAGVQEPGICGSC
jgi:hypothetical protein